MADHRPLALVVDDEPDIRQMVALALEGEGWTVRTASSGREGLALIRERLPELLVVDLMMSGMTGLELCHRMVDELHGGEVPVLLISGVNEKARVLQDFWQSALSRKQFLRKPFDLADLLSAVRGLLPPQVLRALAEAPPVTEPPVTEQPTAPPPPPEDKGYTSAPPELPPWLRRTPAAAAPAKPAPSAPPAQPVPVAPAPPVATTPPAAAPAADEGPKYTGYRVLVMDDEPDIRLILQTALGLYHTVETAENGMEGLEKIDTFLPDFVLSDINMPVMNGLETAEAIRRHPIVYRVPIFFLTAETGKDMPKRAYDVGGNLFLRKPVDPMRVLKCIDYFLGETGLQPNTYLGATQAKAGARPAASSAQPAQAAPGGAGAAAVRVLTVDFNIENQSLLKRLLGDGEVAGEAGLEQIEPLWTEDPRTALGNLARWAPDLILYNPRNPNLDGVAFGQMLKLQKAGSIPIVLVGTRFYEADVTYSQRVLKTPVLDLSQPARLIAQRLSELVTPLRATAKPKPLSLGQIHEEEAEREREMQANNAKAARERESIRQRYSRIQDFIDRTNFN